jgi:hypothetical protein
MVIGLIIGDDGAIDVSAQAYIDRVIVFAWIA